MANEKTNETIGKIWKIQDEMDNVVFDVAANSAILTHQWAEINRHIKTAHLEMLAVIQKLRKFDK